MSRKYIILKASDDSIVGRFKVVSGGYKHTLMKSQDVQRTLGGKIDITQGGIYTQWSYIIRVRHTEEVGSIYSTLEDLESLYRLNNPNATPSDIIKLTTHTMADDASVNVVFIGNFSDQPLTTILDGIYGYYHVSIKLMELPE
ncbi:MAG: hypothetical protein U9N61_11970 [Euryarchaeota archaeon]|nr:hypothetical protein [Euryarchaeota archaeon]